MPRPTAILIILSLAACATSFHLEYEEGQVLDSMEGVVVSEEHLASEVGAAILGRGGNAADAAVATALALGPTYPQAGGLGGGGFAIIVMSGKEPAALDFREVAPAAATADLFADADESLWTRKAAGVPGTPAGLRELHDTYGRLPWRVVIEPSIRLARGFAIPAGLADDLNRHRERFEKDPAAAAIFVKRAGEWEPGDRLEQADLARTLTEFRDLGPAGFYEGRVAELLAADMAARGGIITREDLRGYRPRWRSPALFGFRGRTVITMPLPSSGGVVLEEILTLHDLAGGGEHPVNSAGRLHVFAEASRRAFADRNIGLADPESVRPGTVSILTDPARLAARAATIDPHRATRSGAVEGGFRSGDSTTNLCVVDGEGGAVVITLTLNATFGTHLVAPGTGVVWNNEMDDFATSDLPNQFGLVQGRFNRIVPGRRPLSSMSPTIVTEDGEVVLAVGSPGGPRILSSVAAVILRHVGDGLPLDRAVLTPRIHHQHLPDRISWEPADVTWPDGARGEAGELRASTLRALRRLGHELDARETPIGRITAISVDPRTGRRTAVADPRCYGRPAITGPMRARK